MTLLALLHCDLLHPATDPPPFLAALPNAGPHATSDEV